MSAHPGSHLQALSTNESSANSIVDNLNQSTTYPPTSNDDAVARAGPVVFSQSANRVKSCLIKRRSMYNVPTLRLHSPPDQRSCLSDPLPSSSLRSPFRRYSHLEPLASSVVPVRQPSPSTQPLLSKKTQQLSMKLKPHVPSMVEIIDNQLPHQPHGILMDEYVPAVISADPPVESVLEHHQLAAFCRSATTITTTSTGSSCHFSPNGLSDDDVDVCSGGNDSTYRNNVPGPSRSFSGPDSDADNQIHDRSHWVPMGTTSLPDDGDDNSLVEFDVESGYGASCSSSSTRLAHSRRDRRRNKRRDLRHAPNIPSSMDSERCHNSNDCADSAPVPRSSGSRGSRAKGNRVRIVEDDTDTNSLQVNSGEHLVFNSSLTTNDIPVTSAVLHRTFLSPTTVATTSLSGLQDHEDACSPLSDISPEGLAPGAAMPPPSDAVPTASILVSTNSHSNSSVSLFPHPSSRYCESDPHSLFPLSTHPTHFHPDHSAPVSERSSPPTYPPPTIEHPNELGLIPHEYCHHGFLSSSLFNGRQPIYNLVPMYSPHVPAVQNRCLPLDRFGTISAGDTSLFDQNEPGRVKRHGDASTFNSHRSHSQAASPQRRQSNPLRSPVRSARSSACGVGQRSQSVLLEHRRYSAPAEPYYEINLASPIDTVTQSPGESLTSNRVSLVVDKVRFVIDSDRIRSQPDTMLGRMLNSRFSETTDYFPDLHPSDSSSPDSPSVCQAGWDTLRRQHYRKRTPVDIQLAQNSNISAQLFRAILDYYLVGYISCPPGVPVQELKEACDYFLIPFNHRTVRCNNLRAFLHELTNDGARTIFERFLESHILSLLVKCAQQGERECHLVIVTDEESIDWDTDYPPQMPENELNSHIIHSTHMFRFLKYIENRDVSKQVLLERGLKKIRIGIEGYPTCKDRVKFRPGARPEAIYNYVQCPFVRMSWEEEENKSRHVDFQCVKSKSVSDLTSGLEQAVVDPLPPHLARSRLVISPIDGESPILGTVETESSRNLGLIERFPSSSNVDPSDSPTANVEL